MICFCLKSAIVVTKLLIIGQQGMLNAVLGTADVTFWTLEIAEALQSKTLFSH